MLIVYLFYYLNTINTIKGITTAWFLVEFRVVFCQNVYYTSNWFIGDSLAFLFLTYLYRFVHDQNYNRAYLDNDDCRKRHIHIDICWSTAWQVESIKASD
jgi:hypothetical protein